MADQHSDEGVGKGGGLVRSSDSTGATDQRSDAGVSIADAADMGAATLSLEGATDHPIFFYDVTASPLAADKRSDKGEGIADVADESLKSKGGADKNLDEDQTKAKVASVADKDKDKGDRVTEVAPESLKMKGVADKQSDEGGTVTNATVKASESMVSGSTVEVNVKTLDSELHNFVVDKHMWVSDFKENIASKVGLPVDKQRLIFKGKVLKDEDLLSEHLIENGDTLHLVVRQPSVFQGSHNGNTTNAGEDDGHVSHSVVLGTLGVGDQDEGVVSSDVSQVIGAVLNFIGTGGQVPVGGTGTAQPHMQIPLGAVPAVPTLATPIPQSLHTLSEFMHHMDRALSQTSNSTESFPSVELPSSAHGLPSLAALATVMRQAQRLLSGPAVDSLSHTARRLEEEEGSSDVTVRTQIQTEAVQSGLAMQHLGALFLELGRTMLTMRIGQSPAESYVNAGPAVYISPSGPNPIMVQPFPLQTNSLFSGTATSTLNHGAFGPRHVNIHIHHGPSATNVESNQREHANINGQVNAALPEIRTDARGTGNATSSGTSMQSLNETEGSFSSSRRNIPLGLGPGGLQPKRRPPQTRSEAGSSSGGQLDPATVMNQVAQNPAINNLLSSVSNQNGAGSQDFLNTLMTQLSQNPEMMNTVNQVAQQMDGSQDLTSMLAGMGTPGGSGGGGNLDMSSLIQQMMPFVSQAMNTGGSSSRSRSRSSSSSSSNWNKLAKGSLHRRYNSVKSMNSNERPTDFRMNLENAAHKIVEHYPPLEIFSSVVQTAAALRNNVYDTNSINELCMEEELAQEFNEMLKRDISRRLQ